MRDVTILDYIGNAKELTAEGGRRRMTREEAQSVIMTEQKCVDRANCNRDCANCDLVMDDAVINEALSMAIKALEPPEITDEQAIEHLQASGWMQNHDREIYESGLKERLADDSGDYDSLIPCEDTISRQAAIDTVKKHYRVDNDLLEVIVYELEKLPSAQPEKRTEKRTETHACDLIDRQAAIDALDGEITVTGRANAEAVRGYANLVCDRIKRLPSAQPEQKWIPCSERLPETHKAGNSVSGIFMESKPVLVYGVPEYESEYSFNVVTYCDDLNGNTYWSTEMDAVTINEVTAWMPLPEPYKERREE